MYRNCACDYNLMHSTQCVIVISVTWVHPSLWGVRQEGFYPPSPCSEAKQFIRQTGSTHTESQKMNCSQKEENVFIKIWSVLLEHLLFNCLNISRWPNPLIQSSVFSHQQLSQGHCTEKCLWEQKQEVCWMKLATNKTNFLSEAIG